MNKYKVVSITETDYGCEERLDGQELKSLVFLLSSTNEKGEIEISDKYLLDNNINEGDFVGISEDGLLIKIGDATK